MDVYHYDDYKSYILNKIEENADTKGYRGALAGAAGCGRSFFSQALNTHVHLTLDHGAGLCQFWGFDDDRTDYFLELMNFQRAAGPALKSRAEKRLKRLRAESKHLAKRVAPVETLSSGLKEAVYYSAWHIAAIHALTTITGFQTVVAIAQRLDLSTSLVERSLRDLQSIGLVKPKGEKWVVNGSSVHLPKESPLSVVNQTNWRNQAMRDLSQSPGDGIHYSAIMALSRTDATRVMELLNRAISDALKIAEPSTEEELVCLNLDFFSV